MTSIMDRISGPLFRGSNMILKPSPGFMQYFGPTTQNLLKGLNIGAIRVVSAEARKNPPAFAALMEEIAAANSPQRLYDVIVKGIILKLIAIRECPVKRKADFDGNLEQLIANSNNEFQIIRRQIESYDTTQPQTLEETEISYTLASTDKITNRREELPVSLMIGKVEGLNAFRIHVALPWNSPSLAGKLNQLFGAPWLYKVSPGFIIPENYKMVEYVWQFYQKLEAGPHKPDLMNWTLVQEYLGQEGAMLRGVNFNFRAIEEQSNQKEEAIKIRSKIASQLTRQIDQLFNLHSEQHYQAIFPALYWDLGLIREIELAKI